MNIIVSSFDKDLHSSPNPRFGRSEYFIKYNLEEKTWEALENPAISQSGGAGIAASQFLADQKASVVISGHFGPNAHRALNAAKIKMFTFNNSFQTIEDVIQAYQNDLLEEM